MEKRTNVLWRLPLRVGKLFSILAVCQLLCTQLYAQVETITEPVTLQASSTTLTEVITSFEKQTSYAFSYDKKHCSTVKIQDIQWNKTPLGNALKELKRKAGLQFTLLNKNIAIALPENTKREATPEKKTEPLSGVVLNEKGEPVNGVAVTVKNTANRAVTDEKGAFSFKNAAANAVLSFSYIGYVADDYATGKQRNIEIRMQPANRELSGVVVTALGIKREEKTLGYAAQTVSEGALKDAKTNNWANALSGKVAGLNIMGVGAGPMGSSRITLRGESSLNLDNNQALIVIDGVPVSNKITGTGFTSHLSTDNPVDYGSNVSDLNPDDIEKVTVLKGPGATALYGSRAAAGALIITTKSGSGNKGLGITYNTNLSMDQVNRWPDYQYEYGEGRTNTYYSYLDSEDGPNTSTSAGGGRSWGPKYNGQMYFQFNPDAPDGKPTVRTPWVPYKDSRKGYFQTGTTIANSLSIEGGSDKGNARFSLTHMKNQWIIPNTGFERVNAALSVMQKVTDRFKIMAKVNYTYKKSDNLPAAGYNNQTLMYFLIIGTTTNVRPEWHKPYWMPGLEQIQQRRPFYAGPDNPYLGMYEMLNKIRKNGVTGNISATYEFSPKVDLMVRSGIDMSSEFRSQQRPYSVTKFPQGMYRTQDVFSYEVNSDFLLNYHDRINDKIRFTASGGGNIMRQLYDFAGMNADRLAQPGLYQISNSIDPAVSDPRRSRKGINSLYGMAQVSFDEKVFIDLTGRNDWSSALPYSHNSFFYPSASTSVLLNQLFRLPAAISFAKARFSVAQVGNDTRPYQTRKYYDNVYGNSFTNSPILANEDLKPEITTSYEAGLDLRFFKNRLGIDVTAYTNNSRNQIIAIRLDPTSGYNNKMINAGLINSKGLEVKLTGKPWENRKASWNTTLTWSMNRSYVRRLTDDIQNYVIFAHGNDVTVEARVGGRMGDLYGKGFQRAPDGKIIYGASTGLPAPLDPVTKKWGNAFADWKAGWLNEFTYKNFRMSALVDGQFGGKMFSQTNHKNSEFGNTKNTLYGREGIVGDGVIQDTDGKYVPNAKKVTALAYYGEVYARANAEMNIFSTTFVKIREIRFEYALPQGVLSKLRCRQVLVAVYGRELFNFTKFPGFDPEGGNLNDGTLTPGVELAQFPTARNMGVNLTFKF